MNGTIAISFSLPNSKIKEHSSYATDKNALTSSVLHP
jgi:hypothetical protein